MPLLVKGLSSFNIFFAILYIGKFWVLIIKRIFKRSFCIYWKLLNRSIAKFYSNRWKANKVLQNIINQLEDTWSIEDYRKLVIFTEKKIKSGVERKLKTLDKKNERLINKSRPPLNGLLEEDIKVHKENMVKKPINSWNTRMIYWHVV